MKICFIQSNSLSRSWQWQLHSLEFLWSILRRHFAGKQLVALRKSAPHRSIKKILKQTTIMNRKERVSISWFTRSFVIACDLLKRASLHSVRKNNLCLQQNRAFNVARRKRDFVCFLHQRTIRSFLTQTTQWNNLYFILAYGTPNRPAAPRCFLVSMKFCAHFPLQGWKSQRC